MLKTLFNYFLWEKRDKVKRKSINRKRKDGGLSMVDLEKYFMALKAAWVSRLQNTKGKWADIFKFYVNKTLLPLEYWWKTNFRKSDSFPIVTKLPAFYQDVILAFNNAKYITPQYLLNKHDIVQQPIWGNEYFKINNSCLYLKNFIESRILYVKDLINNNGNIMNDHELYNCMQSKQDYLRSVYIVKNHVIKKIVQFDVNIAPYVKITDMRYIMYNNRRFLIEACKSKFYYEILCGKEQCRGSMESVYAREFSFENNKQIWHNIFMQKVLLKIPKLNEFNFKILNNIVPCGNVLYKWQKSISKHCDFCNNIETTKHMLYECERVCNIWKDISSSVNVNITWKHIVCGFPSYEPSTKIQSINYMISIVTYAIFKENSYCKFKELKYGQVNLKAVVKQNIMYYDIVLKNVDPKIQIAVLCKCVCEKLDSP